MAIQSYRGDDFDVTIQVVDANGDPYDLTDCTILVDVKSSIDQAANASEANALISKTQACTDDPTTGFQNISFVPEDTYDLEANKNYVLGARLKTKGGKLYTLGTDQWFLASEVVRRDS